MLKTFAIIGLVLAVAVIGTLIYASMTQPDRFRIQRAIHINAPAEAMHAILSDLRRGAEWSPFERQDPNLKRTFTGPDTGVGSALEWEGTAGVGAGKLTIADASPTKIVLNLDMRKPMEGHNIVEFDLKPEGTSTNVAWSMHGPMPLIAKVMYTFMNMERSLGNEFEKGLRDLKALAEKS